MASPRPCAGADTDSLPWLAEHYCRCCACTSIHLQTIPSGTLGTPIGSARSVFTTYKLEEAERNRRIMSIIDSTRRTPLLGFTAVVIAVMGLALAAGGTWLAAL